MQLLEGQELVDALHSAVENARKRLWVASPYIGGWPNNVRRILGTKWQTAVKDVRLLTDVSERGYRLNTLQQFFRRGPVRSLRGLHAKLYIVDDFVLSTSANLTGTAFFRRYEAGVILTGLLAKDTASLFEEWWALAKPVREEQLEKPAQTTRDPDAPKSDPLPLRVKPPDDQTEEVLPPDSFGDYDAFLEAYRKLAQIYKSIQRLWGPAPLYFEIDAFLNYLYHDAPGHPSRAYDQKAPRKLSAASQQQQVSKYAAIFAKAYKSKGLRNDSPTVRSDKAKAVQELLKRNLIHGLKRKEIGALLLQLNSMNAYPIHMAQVLNSENNALGALRKLLAMLIDESIPLQRRLAECSHGVFGLGSSSVQELVGFFSGGEIPLRNLNTNCGLRFFGYDVRSR